MPLPHSWNWTRRDFLHVAGSGALVAALGPNAAECAEAESPWIIDCHAHIYSEDEKKYPTTENPYRPPAGKGTIRHLRQEMQANGVRFVTAVQTATFYRWDNRFTADAAREHKDFLVGICNLDPDDPASPKTLEKYVESYNVRGIRSVPAKSGKLDDPGVNALWQTAERLGIVVNVLANADKRPEIETLAKRYPRLPVVIDHCLNLKAGPTFETTLKEMLALASLPQMHAKLSFIATGSDEEYPCRDMHEPCRTIIKAFTPERCVWGSDFPCELWCPKVTYGQNLRIITKELGLDQPTQRAILRDTPLRLWFQGRGDGR